MARGSSKRHRTLWKSTYATTPYGDLPWFDPDPSPSVVEAVREGFLRGGKVLDVGCGAGSNVLYLARNGFASHGVDLAPDAVGAARQRASAERLRIDVRVGDALDLDFPAGTFDGLTDHGCFHTLPLGRRRDYAREVARVVRPGGSVVLDWVGRESTRRQGPPHRPSLAEVTLAFEDRFVFVRTSFHESGGGRPFATYRAWMTRRTAPQPPRR